MATGIRKRHSTTCKARQGGKCRCDGRWEAWVYLPREERKVYKSFALESEAKSWRADATAAANAGKLTSPSKQTIKEAGEAWLEGAKAGRIRDRSGRPYKPSTLRGYNEALKLRIYPEFGPVRLSELRRADIQALVDRLLADGLTAGTIRNTLNPLRAIYRHAIRRDLVSVNPTSELDVPAARGRRDRIAPVTEATTLIEALPRDDQALWATAFFAGLRRGELRALRWSDVDLGKSEIQVERSWDEREGAVDPKTDASTRTVPLVAVLRDYLVAHKLEAKPVDGEALAFGRSATDSFVPTAVRRRAIKAWGNAKLDPITLHECRHTFASLLIDAGVNAKAIQAFMGHSTIEMTFNQYGHLMPGSRDQARDLVDEYISAAVAEGAAEAKLVEHDGNVQDAATLQDTAPRSDRRPADSVVGSPHMSRLSDDREISNGRG